MTLLRIHRLDVVARHRELVEYGDQFAALQLGLDLPGRAPAHAQTLLDPAVEQLAIVAGQVALDTNGEQLAVAKEGPAALLPAGEVEGEAVVAGEVLGLTRDAVALEVVGRAAHHATVGEQAHGDVVGVGHLADADRHVVALAHEVDHAVGEVEGHAQLGVQGLEGGRVRGHVAAAEGGGRGHHQMAAHQVAPGADRALEFVELAQQRAALVEQLLAKLGQRQAPRRAVHQLDPEAFLQRVEPPPHDHRGHALHQRRGREAALLGHQHEAAQFGVAIHFLLQGRRAPARPPDCDLRRSYSAAPGGLARGR